MKLIVGLGNPGLLYNNTRHNVGFRYIDILANYLNAPSFKEKFNGMFTKININGEEVILLKPLSYMNLSGEVVLEFSNYYKIKSTDILIIHDDLDMKVAKIKLKENGSSGGHNGIKNIILNLKTEEFKRLKIGISKDKNIDTADYVLGKFSKIDLEELDNINKIVINIIKDYLKLPFNDLMSKYNNNNNWRIKHEETK